MSDEDEIRREIAELESHLTRELSMKPRDGPKIHGLRSRLWNLVRKVPHADKAKNAAYKWEESRKRIASAMGDTKRSKPSAAVASPAIASHTTKVVTEASYCPPIAWAINVKGINGYPDVVVGASDATYKKIVRSGFDFRKFDKTDFVFTVAPQWRDKIIPSDAPVKVFNPKALDSIKKANQFPGTYSPRDLGLDRVYSIGDMINMFVGDMSENFEDDGFDE